MAVLRVTLLFGISFFVFVQARYISQEERGIRLVNGSLPNEGRIEITINRMDWFTVCSNRTYWTPQKSEVVCRQLGYPGHVRTFFDAFFGRGAEPVGMMVDHIDCTGDEQHLRNCSFNTRRSLICTHAQDMSILCRQPGYVGCYGPDFNKGIDIDTVQPSHVPLLELTPFNCIVSCSRLGLGYAVLSSLGCWCVTSVIISNLTTIDNTTCTSPCSESHHYGCGNSNEILAIFNVMYATCTKPGALQNGDYQGTRYLFGDSIHFTCHGGYIMNGRSNLQCLIGENHRVEWNNPKPFCEEINSPSPSTAPTTGMPPIQQAFQPLTNPEALPFGQDQSTNRRTTPLHGIDVTTGNPDIITTQTASSKLRTIPIGAPTTSTKSSGIKTERSSAADKTLTLKINTDISTVGLIVSTVQSTLLSSKEGKQNSTEYERPWSSDLATERRTDSETVYVTTQAADRVTNTVRLQTRGPTYDSKSDDSLLIWIIISAVIILFLVLFVISCVLIGVFLCCRKPKPVFRVSSAQLPNSGVRSSFIFRRGSCPDSYRKFEDEQSTISYVKPDVVTIGTTFGQEVHTSSYSGNESSSPKLGGNSNGDNYKLDTLKKTAATMFRISGDNMYDQFDFGIPKQDEISDEESINIPTSFLEDDDTRLSTV
ncbi:hypothetical protein BSL78_24316 [Apostichopus japonicus]|uniref:Uncharacterized protein n=1 Tax=Stichopus japonicus TaxID=307972 RepID=A0A2G8JT11_STIJA|nr:hypothetical protein BSL78_24316 [Apostichopus japonicus]